MLSRAWSDLCLLIPGRRISPLICYAYTFSGTCVATSAFLRLIIFAHNAYFIGLFLFLLALRIGCWVLTRMLLTVDLVFILMHPIFTLSALLFVFYLVTLQALPEFIRMLRL